MTPRTGRRALAAFWLADGLTTQYARDERIPMLTPVPPTPGSSLAFT